MLQFLSPTVGSKNLSLSLENQPQRHIINVVGYGYINNINTSRFLMATSPFKDYIYIFITLTIYKTSASIFPQEQAFKQLDVPFLNRFEKQLLQPADLLPPDRRTMIWMDGIVNLWKFRYLITFDNISIPGMIDIDYPNFCGWTIRVGGGWIHVCF